MEFIPLKNERLKTILDSIIDGFFTNTDVQAALKRVVTKKDSLIPDLYPCSDEYLYQAMKHPIEEFGYPRGDRGTGMGKNGADFNWEKFLPVQHRISKVGMFLGTPANALTMLYPDNGYIGWHHNGNAPGYNILITHSQDGNGRFKYFHREKQQIVTHEDPVGWSVKVGYYANQRSEADRVYWHCAETSKARMSIAWIINHREMWKNMINEISNGEFDQEVLNQHQMKV